MNIHLSSPCLTSPTLLYYNTSFPSKITTKNRPDKGKYINRKGKGDVKGLWIEYDLTNLLQEYIQRPNPDKQIVLSLSIKDHEQPTTLHTIYAASPNLFPTISIQYRDTLLTSLYKLEEAIYLSTIEQSEIYSSAQQYCQQSQNISNNLFIHKTSFLVLLVIVMFTKSHFLNKIIDQTL